MILDISNFLDVFLKAIWHGSPNIKFITYEMTIYYIRLKLHHVVIGNNSSFRWLYMCSSRFNAERVLLSWENAIFFSSKRKIGGRLLRFLRLSYIYHHTPQFSWFHSWVRNKYRSIDFSHFSWRKCSVLNFPKLNPQLIFSHRSTNTASIASATTLSHPLVFTLYTLTTYFGQLHLRFSTDIPT